jgi:hypothetical protein
MILKHWFHFTRRARQQHDCRAFVIDEHTGRCTIRIGKHVGVLYHHCLARVSLRHRDAEALKPLLDFSKHILIQQ